MKIFGEDYRVKESKCPACGVPLDAAGSFANREEAPPSEGDWSMCIHCGEALRFTETIELRLATNAEMLEFAEEAPRQFFLFRKAQQAARQIAAEQKMRMN